MESLQQEQACSSGLKMSILQSNLSSLLPDLCANSSVRKITDETFPYISGIFDDTMDPSLISDIPIRTTDVPDQVQLKALTKTQDEVISGAESQTKAAYNSWLSIPIDNGHSIDFSITEITSAQDDHEGVNVPESNSTDVPDTSGHSPKSASCTVNCELGVASKNSTFDMAKDLKERFSGLNLTKPVSNETIGSNNVTFEKSEELQEKSSSLSCTISNDDASLEDKHLNEKRLNSTVDVCDPSNSSTEQPNQKLNGTVDITQSTEPKQEESTKGQMCTMDHEKQSTFVKVAEETSATVDLTAGVPTEVSLSGSVTVEPVDQKFTKHNATTDLTPPEPVPDVAKTTVNTITSEKLPIQSSAICGETVKDTAVSGPSAPGNTAAPVRVDVTVCSEGTLELPEADCKEEQQDPFRRRNGNSDGDGYLNLDISQSSIFSLDEMLDFKPCPLIASTPIVLGRCFDRLGTAKPSNIQKQLPVMDSISTRLSQGIEGVGEHNESDASKTNQLSAKPDASDQTQKVSANRGSNSATSEEAIVNKAPLKPVVRRKIPQPAFKSSIPKSQLLPRPSTVQLSLAAARAKAAAAPAQALNQPETSSSALHSMRRTVNINKGKPPASAKNTSTVKCSPVAPSTSTANLTSEKRAGNSNTQMTKPSGLQPPGRGRFGLKPPGSAVSAEETGHSQTNNKPTGLSGVRTRNSPLLGFSQKHASSDALPFAKRKKTDLQNQASCAEAPAASEAGGGVQGNVTACSNNTSKRPSSDCRNCLLLQEKLRTFDHYHEELGEFHQELRRLPADCKKWGLLQQKLESYLQEVKRLQTGIL